MKVTISKRICIVMCAVALLLSSFNLYLTIDNTRSLQEKVSRLQRDYSADDSIFRYVIFRDGELYKAKNQSSGSVDFSSAAASIVISQAVAKGTLVYIKAGIYSLTADVNVVNKRNARIVSDGAVINGNGHRITICGDNFSLSQYNLISGLRIVNGTIRIENSFGTTISDMIFESCSVALELANTETWSEGTKIDNIHFINCTEGIAFRTPTANATGSYANTQISRCFFNMLNNSVGINIERAAEYSDSQFLNSRLWMGEYGQYNQTGLLINGSMFQTLISGVVFESFAESPRDLYAVVFGKSAETTPTFVGGVSFLGNWSARIHNPYSKWISGIGSVFCRENINIQVGSSSTYGEAADIHARPLTISNFKPRIRVEGKFGAGEIVTVRFRLELADNVISGTVEKSFTNSSSLWLDNEDLFQLLPSQNIIWAILIDAKSTAVTTDVSVKVDIYGTVT